MGFCANEQIDHTLDNPDVPIIEVLQVYGVASIYLICLKVSLVVELGIIFYLSGVCSGRFLVPTNTLVIDGRGDI